MARDDRYSPDMRMIAPARGAQRNRPDWMSTQPVRSAMQDLRSSAERFGPDMRMIAPARETAGQSGPGMVERMQRNIREQPWQGVAVTPASAPPATGRTRGSDIYGDSFLFRARDALMAEPDPVTTPEGFYDRPKAALSAVRNAAATVVPFAFQNDGASGARSPASLREANAVFDENAPRLPSIGETYRMLLGQTPEATADSAQPPRATAGSRQTQRAAPKPGEPGAAQAQAQSATRSAAGGETIYTGRYGTPVSDSGGDGRNPANTLTSLDTGLRYGVPAVMPGMLGDSEKNYAGRTALEESREANRIRQMTLDSLALRDRPFNAAQDAIFINQNDAGLTEQVNDLMSQAVSATDGREAARLQAQARELIRATGVAGDIDTAQMREAGDMERALMEAGIECIESPYRSALAQAALESSGAQAARALATEAGDVPTPGALSQLQELLYSMGVEEDAMAEIIRPLASRYLASVDGRAMADGGLVEPLSAIGRAPAMLTPQMPDQQLMAEYQQLSSGLSAMGLPPVDFETFQSMKFQPDQRASTRSPTAGVMGFADGGPVPDASGQMVVDPDPNALTDSIPAMVDGAAPAALDSGEFVLPKDVVLFYGLDKLNKMIAQARKVETDGTSDGQSGVSAVQAAQRDA